MTDLATLKALAKAATPGPWIDYGRDGIVQAPHYEDRPISVFVNCRKHDRDFILAANPAAILALLERLERAEAALRRMATDTDGIGICCQEWNGRLAADFIAEIGHHAERLAVDARAVLAAIPKEGT